MARTSPATKGVVRVKGSSLHRFAGFTLAESMIASVVLAVSVIGVSLSVSASYQQSASLDEASTSSLLARQMLERIANEPFASIDSWHNYADYGTGTSMTAGTTNDTGVYTRKVTITRTATLGGATDVAGKFAEVTVVIHTPRGVKESFSRILTDLDVELE